MNPIDSGQPSISQVVLDETGQGLTEYALILALIALVTIAGLELLGNTVTSALSSVGSSI
jgi:Flp pilus assembly pilin Flp